MEELKRLARTINDILTSYIKIHDSLHKRSIRHVIPIPGIFKPIPFGFYGKQLEQCSASIEELLRKMQESPHAQNPDFIDVLSEYSMALQDAIERLREFCVCLEQKADGKPYAFTQQKKDQAEYEAAVKHYKLLGNKLNSEFDRITGRFN